MLSIINLALAPFAWEAVTTGGRIWNPDGAPMVTAVRCYGGGFAVALGRRWEMTVSPRYLSPR
jgi:hypothetical protein